MKFAKIIFNIAPNKYYVSIGSRTFPIPKNHIVINKPLRNEEYINISICEKIQVYNSEKELLADYTTPIEGGFNEASNIFKLEGDIHLLKFPVFIVDNQYGISPPPDFINIIGLKI